MDDNDTTQSPRPTLDLNADNKRAWDDLYASTRQSVWGQTPLGFVYAYANALGAVLPATPRVLDAATGEGRNLGALSAWAGRLCACDTSPHALRKIPATLKQRTHRLVCDLSQLPYATASFDLILATDVIETLPDPEQALGECSRVLDRRGKLLCNIPDMKDGIAAVNMTGLGENRYLYQDLFYYRFFTAEEAVELLRGCGLEVLSCEEHSWEEECHPNFRDHRHQHTSRVFLAEKVA